ncbi:MAG: HEAT repeat domain-containing protein [Methanothrix sp.]
MIDQADIHRKANSSKLKDREEAVELLRTVFSHIPDKVEAWHDLIRLTENMYSGVRWQAASSLGFVFSHVPDKFEAWYDLHKLTQDENSYVRMEAAYSLGSAFSHVPDKFEAWHDLHKLTHDEDSGVRMRAASSLNSAFSHIPDKVEAWHDLHKLTQDEDSYVRREAACSLIAAFFYIPDKIEVWHDLIKLIDDEDPDVRMEAAHTLGFAFSQLPYKIEAWHELIRLTEDGYSGVRMGAAFSLDSVFLHVLDKVETWHDIIRLTEDGDSNVRMYAYHSLGKAFVYKATESEDVGVLRTNLENAVEYFGKSVQESEDSPAKFCHPFYRSYFALTFQGESQEAIQKYLAEAKAAVGGSQSRDELLKAVENLAGALKEAQRTWDMQLAGMQCDLKAYMRYCNQAAEYLNQAEKDAPSATKLIRKGLPNIDQRIKEIIGSIQEKAQTICIQGKGTGTALEAAGLELNHWAKELSFENVLKSERSCSRIEYTLQNFCNRLPVDKRSNICEVVKEIGKEEELPNKLTKIELALSFILNEWPIDYDVRKKLDEIHDDIKSLRQSILDRFEISEQKILSSIFERLDKDKLEIISSLLDAIKENRIPKDLTEEALKATKDLIAEMKSIQIQDPKIAKCVDSWEEAINSPELGIENLIKVTIPIIPFFLTYEGSYKFQTSIKLDSVWNKLRALVRR